MVSPTFSSQPVAEAAFENSARQKSIVTFSRTGEIQFIDDFEDGGTKWEEGLAGTGAATGVSVLRARSGKQSILLTAGSTSTRISQIIHRAPLSTLSRMGGEISFLLADVIELFTINIRLRDGTNRTTVNLRYDELNTELQISDEEGVFVSLGTVDLQNLDTLFHTMKLVFDPLKGEYVRAQLDNLNFDLKGTPAQVVTDATGAYIEITLTLIGTSTENDRVYVDDFILTHNEALEQA